MAYGEGASRGNSCSRAAVDAGGPGSFDVDGSKENDGVEQLLHKDELRPAGHGHVSIAESNAVDLVDVVLSKHIFWKMRQDETLEVHSGKFRH